MGTITIPASVKYIGEAAFMRCSVMVSLTCAANGELEYIGSEAFSECVALSNVKLSAKLSYIGEKAFYMNTALASINVPADCTAFSTPNDAFLIDTASKTLIFACHKSGTSIPTDGSVEYIGEYAFYKNNFFILPTIPASIKEIGNFAFAYAGKLSELRVADNSQLEKIGNSAFLNASLRTATFGSNCKLREIGDNAFDSAGLTSFTVPASVEKLGRACFAGNWTMVSFAIEEGTKLKELPIEMLYGSSGVKKVVIPEGITTIRTKAFYNIYSITEIYIPSTVTTIESKVVASAHDPAAFMNPQVFCVAAEKPAGWAEDWIDSDIREPIFGYVPED